MSTVMVTGDRGFIGSYIVKELLGRDHTVIGVDNESKYGKVSHPWDELPSYCHNNIDASNTELMVDVVLKYKPQFMIMGAAMIGGISYFHTLPFSLLARNEQIMASQFDAAIKGYHEKFLDKVTIISSSMVYEGCRTYPHIEGDELINPPPSSSYGFQKLSTEYFARAAYDEFKLPYTIVRPFNCVGTGEVRALVDHEISSGNVKLAMSHVVPDLIQKIYKGQNPLILLGNGHQVRQYTYAGDLARGIVDATFSEHTSNEDYNLSTQESTSVVQLAYRIWMKMKPKEHFVWEPSEGFKYDVYRREASSLKALSDFGWKAEKSLDEILDIVIPWTTAAIDKGLL
jgi:UDP-glucose 4-epimerase